MIESAGVGLVDSRAPHLSIDEIVLLLTSEVRRLKASHSRTLVSRPTGGPRHAHSHRFAEPAKAADKLVRTHHPQAKEKPKAAKEPRHAKETTAGKAHKPSRAEKHAAKASALEGARRAAKKSAKT